MAKEKLSFKPKEVTKKLLSALSERACDILVQRYGLDKEGERSTLEAIGSRYGITRERVRQIENFAIATVKKGPAFSKMDTVFVELKKIIERHGGIVHEQEFLETLSSDIGTQNHIHFLLVLSDLFQKLKEDDEFHHRWTIDNEVAEKVHKSLHNLCQNITDRDLVTEAQLISDFLNDLKKVISDPRLEEFAKRWIKISKAVSQNPLGEWGLSASPNVKMRGIRDFAYLTIRKEGKPMHFAAVAKSIEKLFGKKAHPATCHNELIKDKRFVLVGRGLYALTEWGYQKGVVRDVIRDVLKKNGPQTKDEVVKSVMKERVVKENTILVNLQNPKYFKKSKDGKYSVA